jgi:glycogen synthase
MKVLMLTKEYPPHVYGGAGVHVEYLSRALARLVEVEVRCFGDQDESRPNLRVKGFGAYGIPYGGPAPVRPVFEAARRCVDFNSAGTDAAVVHCHTWYVHLGGILARLNYGVPLVITAHSLEPLRPWKREQLAGGYDYALWVEKTAMEMADTVIAVSTEMRNDILRLYRVRPDKVKIVYNGIDTDEYQPLSSSDALARHGIDPAQPYLLFVGRISRQKGIIHLVRAIQYMKPGFQVALCAGAPDTREIGEEMQAAVEDASRKREGIIWIREMLDRKSVIELYSHAAVFCCPSIYEPFGITNLEAMACEVPVVASAVGGISEIVVDGETGFLVPVEIEDGTPPGPQEPDKFARDLAERIDRLMSDPNLRRRFGTAGRKRAVAQFNWPAIAEQTKAVYESLTP